MADDSEKNPDLGAAAAKPAGRARPTLAWFLKFLAWCGLMTIVVAAVFSLVAYVAYLNLTQVVNLALKEFVKPWQIEVGDIDMGKRGLVRVEDLSVLSTSKKGDAAPLFAAGSVELDYDFSELRDQRKFRAIRLESPVIRIDDGLLADKKESNPGEIAADADSPPVLEFLGHFTDSLSVTGGKVEVALEKLPPISLDWNAQTGPLDFAGSDWLTTDPIQINLENLRVGERGEHVSIAALDIAVRIRSDFKRFEAGALHLEDPLFRITPESIPDVLSQPGVDSREGSPKTEKADEQVAATAVALAILLEAVRIDRARFELAGFESLPDVSFESSIDWGRVHFEDGEFGIGDGEALSLTLQNLIIDGREISPAGQSADRLGRIGSVEMTFLPNELVRNQRVESIRINQPVIHWNRETGARMISRFFSPDGSEAEEGEASTPPDSKAAISETGDDSSRMEIGSLVIRKGRFKVSEFPSSRFPIPDIGLDLDLALNNLRFGGADTFGASESQKLTIRNLLITTPDSGPGVQPLLKADEISGEVDWESLKERKQAAQLSVVKPEINLTDTTLAPWLKLLADIAANSGREGEFDQPLESAAVEEGSQLRPPVWKVDDLSVSGGVCRIDTKAFGPKAPKVQGAFNIETVSLVDTTETAYRANLPSLRLYSRPEPAGGEQSGQDDIGMLKNLRVGFTAEGIQREKRIDWLEVPRGEIIVGAGMDRLMKGGQEASGSGASEDNGDPAESAVPENAAGAAGAAGDDCQQPAETRVEAQEAQAEARDESESGADGSDEKGWSIGNVHLRQIRVEFESLIPQVEGLEIPDVEINLSEVPLGSGMLADKTQHEVILRDIRIRDPYSGFQPVAILPEIRVDFTLAGVVGRNGEVEEVRLYKPELFIGEPLFNWIKYQREHQVVELPGAAEAAQPLADDEPQWKIPVIKATDGNLIIAPVGYPITTKPFPFNATTTPKTEEGKTGEIELELLIPEESTVYLFPDLKLELHGLSGEIEFNKENNADGKTPVLPLHEIASVDPDANDSFTDASADSQALVTGDLVEFQSNGKLPAPLKPGTSYRIETKHSPTEWSVKKLKGDEQRIDLTDAGTGTHFWKKPRAINTVLTFKLKEAKWQDYEATDLALAVTFDQLYVHGDIWASAYGGNVNGAFNLYLDALGQWDAWIAGTRMEMEPITAALTPEKFTMKGIVDCKLISEGFGLEFGETTGSIVSKTPGWLNVDKLEEIPDLLPEDWSMMQTSAVEVLLDALKDFPYEEARGETYFVGRDGWVRMRMTGPEGSRNFNLFAHDWRRETGGAEAPETTATTDSNPPDLSGRPD